MGDYQRVGAFARPGDWVALFVTTHRDNEEFKTTLLFSRVQVLGVGVTSEEGTAVSNTKEKTDVTSAVMTLALTPLEAAKMVNATGIAEDNKAYLQFALLPANGSVPANTNATSSIY
jgi:Flp pilus assembly protein CpaB